MDFARPTVQRVSDLAIEDPPEPDLFPTAFPREGFPRYDWTRRPQALPARVWTTETTHRDG
jgi:2-phosphinomethylmalic acid synthase